MHVAAYVLEDKLFGLFQCYKNWFWIILIVLVVILVIVLWWIYWLIHKLLCMLVNQFCWVEVGNLMLLIMYCYDDEFGYLYQCFNLMVSWLHMLIQQVYEEKIWVQCVELKWLQVQINSYFLYNSYFILLCLICGGDNETVFRFAIYLGEYMQYVMCSDVDEVLFEREWRHVVVYVEIQNICFQDWLRVEFPLLLEGAGACFVMRFILQLLIENVYKYVMELKFANGWVEIGIVMMFDLFVFIIEDNGEKLVDVMIDVLNECCWMDPDKEIEGTGLFNIHWWLQIKYGVLFGLSFFCSGLGGLKVELCIEGWRDNYVQNVDCG